MLIGIIGQKGAGKDTFAQGLEGFANVKMADPLKEMLRTLLRMTGAGENRIEQMIEGDLKEVPCEEFCGQSPRYAMQTLGTEWRNMIGLNLWRRIWAYRVEQLENVVCTDIRFQHEIEAIQERGGVVIRIDRPGQRHEDLHSSETEMAGLPYDLVIVNDGTPTDLIRKARELVQ
jgi:hypothetical protein